MADEQPGHIARGVRDVSKVPLAKELVKNNVGSTVKHQEHSSKFVVVSQAESAAASAHYLDPSLQARLVQQSPTAPSPAITTRSVTGAGSRTSRENTGTTPPSGGDGVNENCVEVQVPAAETRPAGQPTEAAEKMAQISNNKGPTVIMSDMDNYRPDPSCSKKRKKTCCIQ